MPESSPTPRRSAYARLLDKATRILAMRDHSEHELRRKLASAPTFPGSHKAEQPDFTPEDIEKVIAWCYEHRWLDDAQFAARFIASRSRKGYGPQRIRQELQQKGIDRATGEAAHDGVRSGLAGDGAGNGGKKVWRAAADGVERACQSAAFSSVSWFLHGRYPGHLPKF